MPWSNWQLDGTASQRRAAVTDRLLLQQGRMPWNRGMAAPVKGFTTHDFRLVAVSHPSLLSVMAHLGAARNEGQRLRLGRSPAHRRDAMRITAAILLAVVAASAMSEELSLALPFEGRWFVMQGGDTLNVNHHMRVPAQAFGIDFAKANGRSGRELAKGRQRRARDFYSWGQAVLAPADGTVVHAESNHPDNPLGTKDHANPAGNHVVLELPSSNFFFVAHMQRRSLKVKAGDFVRRGETLGLCGNSGNSDFPQIHIHIQDSPVLNSGTGQNPVFGPIDVELTGKQFRGVTWPLIRGLFVSNASNSKFALVTALSGDL